MSPVLAASGAVRPKPRLALEMMMVLKDTRPSSRANTVGHCCISSIGSTVALSPGERVAGDGMGGGEREGSRDGGEEGAEKE